MKFAKKFLREYFFSGPFFPRIVEKKRKYRKNLNPQKFSATRYPRSIKRLDTIITRLYTSKPETLLILKYGIYI